MEIKGIKLMGPFFDGSGYAEAARQYVVALHKMGVPLTLQNIIFEEARPNLGETGILIDSLVGKLIDYNIKIIQLTPEHYPMFKEDGVFNIGYSFWETTGICKHWVDSINNSVQMCFVPCQWNADCYKESGVSVPIKVIYQGADFDEFDTHHDFNIPGISKDTYLFYSIFQWNERKHPVALLKAFWHAFQNDEDVALVLKTHRINYSDSEKDLVRSSISNIKSVTPFEKYPKIVLLPNLLSRQEIIDLHHRGDCFVMLHRGEGWGMPHFEAGICGNPVIATRLGGNVEFMKDDNSYLVDYVLTPVHGMNWIRWYDGSQLWAEPDVKQAADYMRHVYHNRDDAKNKGQLLKGFIRNNFSWDKVTKDIVRRIEGV